MWWTLSKSKWRFSDKRNKLAMVDVAIVILLIFTALFAPAIAPYDPETGRDPTAFQEVSQVVGNLGQNGSFLYDDGEVTMLDSLPAVQAAGWVRLIPTAINNRGWITGYGSRGSGQSDKAFLLIPR